MPVNKVRRNGSYAPLSAHYYKDTALIAAGEKAEVLYTRSLAFCAEVLSDGLVTDQQLPFLAVGLTGVKARVAALVREGLWERDDERNGWIVRSWLKWNRSREEIAQLMEKDSERKQPGRGGRRRTDSDRKPDGSQPESDPDPDGGPHGFQPHARAPRHTTPTPTPDPGADRTPSGPVRSAPTGTPPPANRAAGGAPDNPHWRTQPAFGTPRDPQDAERARRGAAQARAAVTPPRRQEPATSAFDRLIAATTPPQEPAEPVDPDNVHPLRSVG